MLGTVERTVGRPQGVGPTFTHPRDTSTEIEWMGPNLVPLGAEALEDGVRIAVVAEDDHELLTTEPAG